MFGGHDDNSPTPQDGSAGDSTLNGVTDLVGGTAIPGPGDPGYIAPAPEPTPSDSPAPQDDETPEAPVSAGSGDTPDDLLEIKQQALQQLSPLLGHLDQSPEEKFRTTMMLIQAADNQALLKDAFEAAKQIGDDKLRAQALLDVINEINYFTQQKP